MMPFKELKAWQACHDLALAIYRQTADFPRTELYGLTSQMRRAAYSAAANIAEGSVKRGNRELRRYLDISLGSLSEISYALLLARDLNILKAESFDSLEAQRALSGKLVWGLYRSLDA